MFITKFDRSYEIKYINKPKVYENLPCSEFESTSNPHSADISRRISPELVLPATKMLPLNQIFNSNKYI